MDVYTNLPSNAYILNTRFTEPVTGLSATAIKRSQYGLLIAGYQIIIIFAISGIWQLASNVVFLLFPLRDRQIRFIGLIAFWNAHDPWSAVYLMTSYVWNVLGERQDVHKKANTSQRGKPTATGNDFWLGMLLLLTAFLLAVGGIVAGIFYTDSLQIGQAAPVHPASVFLPNIELFQGDLATALRYQAAGAPSVLRALGSAESVDDNTRRQSVSIGAPRQLPDSNETHPKYSMDYSYTITAADFGLQTHRGLVHNVKGRCETTYDWLHPLDVEGSWPGSMEVYYPWDDTASAVPVDGPMWPVRGHLELAAITQPQSLEGYSSNQTYALIIKSANVQSYSSTTDPWYFTERIDSLNSNLSKEVTITAPYRVKPGRPALSCWQNTEFCFRGACSSRLFENHRADRQNISEGLRDIFTTQFANPMIVSIGLAAGVSALRSFVGSVRGTMIDAASAKMQDEVTRLVLAGYLASKEVLRDVTLMQRGDFENFLLDDKGNPKPGAADFVIKTGDVVSVRLDLLILAPVICVVLWVLVGLLTLLKRVGQGKEGRFALRPKALRATDLFRIMDEEASSRYRAGKSEIESTETNWYKEKTGVPVLREESVVTPHIFYNDETNRVSIRFTGDPNRNAAASNTTPNTTPSTVSNTAQNGATSSSSNNPSATTTEVELQDSRQSGSRQAALPDLGA